MPADRTRYEVTGARWGARHGSVVVYLTDDDGTRWACVAHVVGHAYPAPDDGLREVEASEVAPRFDGRGVIGEGSGLLP